MTMTMMMEGQASSGTLFLWTRWVSSLYLTSNQSPQSRTGLTHRFAGSTYRNPIGLQSWSTRLICRFNSQLATRLTAHPSPRSPHRTRVTLQPPYTRHKMSPETETITITPQRLSIHTPGTPRNDSASEETITPFSFLIRCPVPVHGLSTVGSCHSPSHLAGHSISLPAMTMAA
jgi:hypothetical protein